MDKNILIVWVVSGGLLIASVACIVLSILTLNYKRALQLMVARDRQQTTDRTLAEESRKKLEKAFLQGQKLQAIGTLAGGIAHDFNNILYAIIGYAEMAREDIDPASPIRANLGKIQDAANRGKDLVSRILSFSRRQHHELHPLCLKDSIEGALELLRSTIPTSIAIHTEFGTEKPFINGNQTQLHQVIVNLVTNAVDAMDGEGTLSIRLDTIPAESHLYAQPDNPNRRTGYCRLTLTDTGHGIDPAHMERIFEPFFTTKEVGRGTGLGLSTVHSIITSHKGEIMVDSQPGHGTTFTLLLPIHEDIGEQRNG